ncbi:MAG: hypothetical protein MR648_03555 [Clostridiales bacterium]|nr:hypothetical protein [Clostridiales bacterium]
MLPKAAQKSIDDVFILISNKMLYLKSRALRTLVPHIRASRRLIKTGRASRCKKLFKLFTGFCISGFAAGPHLAAR